VQLTSHQAVRNIQLLLGRLYIECCINGLSLKVKGLNLLKLIGALYYITIYGQDGN